MADNVEVIELDKPPIDIISPEVRQQMDLSLGIKPEPKIEEGKSVDTNEESGKVSEPPVFTFDILKEKFGYEKPEDVLTEIEALRTFKANPTPAEIKYENEQSQKIAQALQAGKIDEVYAFLDEQKRLDKYTTVEVDDKSADDILRLAMQLKHKDLTSTEIDYKLKKQYSTPKEPKIGDDELEEDFNVRHNEWKEVVEDVKMSKIIDAKLVKPELELAKSKLVLPELDIQSGKDEVEYQRQLEEDARLHEETKQAYKSLQPSAIESKMSFNDETNKIQFDFSFLPDIEGFNNAVEMVSDPEKFFKSFTNSDGTPNRKQFLEAVYFAKNKDRILLAAMTDAKNATIKALIPDNSGGGGQRQLPQDQNENELDKLMKLSLQGYS